MTLYSSNLDSGFVILRLVTDALRGTSVPVGAIAWDRGKEWYGLRLLGQAEGLREVTQDRRQLLNLTRSKLEHWAETRAVPYAPGTIEPWTSAFWESARRVLTTGIRLDTPKAMDPLHSEEELDLLFDAVVQPIEAPSRTRRRMEGVLKRALGKDLTKHTKARLELAAFHQAREVVTRGAKASAGILAIEAVHLAGKNARRDADALVSKLMRIRSETPEALVFRPIIGYTASPGGLNGETHMKEWMREKITPDVFDLLKDDRAFREQTRKALADIAGEPTLPF